MKVTVPHPKKDFPLKRLIRIEKQSGIKVIYSSITHDVYYRIINPQASEKQRVMVGRIMVVLAIAIAGYGR